MGRAVRARGAGRSDRAARRRSRDRPSRLHPPDTRAHSASYGARPSPERTAIERFAAAIERDPAYARAHAAIADTYAVMGSYGMMPIRDSHPRGRTAALKALEIDDTLAEAHAALATITSDYYWDGTEAERRFRLAIELNPSYATAHHWYSSYLANMGRFDEALAAARRAEDQFGYAHLCLGLVYTQNNMKQLKNPQAGCPNPPGLVDMK